MKALTLYTKALTPMPSPARAQPVRPTSRIRKTEGDLCEVQCIDAVKVRRAQKAMKSSKVVTNLAETFRVLGDATRLRIVHALSDHEPCVCDLATVLGVEQSVVSHSLSPLRQMQLVRFRKDGKIAYYSLDDDHIASLVGEGFRHVEEHAR